MKKFLLSASVLILSSPLAAESIVYIDNEANLYCEVTCTDKGKSAVFGDYVRYLNGDYEKIPGAWVQDGDETSWTYSEYSDRVYVLNQPGTSLDDVKKACEKEVDEIISKKKPEIAKRIANGRLEADACSVKPFATAKTGLKNYEFVQAKPKKAKADL